MMKRIFKNLWLVFFVAAAFILISSCATAPPAKEEAKAEPAKKEEAKPAAPAPKELTEADGVAKGGILKRTNPPAFELEYPTSMEPRNLSPGQIFSKGQGVSPFSLQVAISDLGEDGFDAWVKEAGEGWVAALKGLGSSKVEILRTDPTDLYDEYKAVEMEIEWLWTDGNTLLTNINHYILKGDKVITLSGTAMGDSDPLVAIYETIDLDP